MLRVTIIYYFNCGYTSIVSGLSINIIAKDLIICQRVRDIKYKAFIIF